MGDLFKKWCAKKPTSSNGSTESTQSSTSNVVYGIDVYHGDEVTDWKKVKASGKDFIFIKFSESLNYKDQSAQTYAKDANEAGLLVGAYHFLHANSSGMDQAKWFLDTVGTAPINLGYVMDFETMNGVSPKDAIINAVQFCNFVKLHTQKDPIIYGSPSFLSDLELSDQFKNNKLWVAHYGVAAPTIPKPWNKPTFWQYSESGSCPGVSNSCDLDLFYGTLDELKALGK